MMFEVYVYIYMYIHTILIFDSMSGTCKNQLQHIYQLSVLNWVDVKERFYHERFTTYGLGFY